MRSAAPTGQLATTQDLYDRKAFLIIGADLAIEQPFLSFQIRASKRHHDAHIYVVTAGSCSRRSIRNEIHPQAGRQRTRCAAQNSATHSRPNPNW